MCRVSFKNNIERSLFKKNFRPFVDCARQILYFISYDYSTASPSSVTAVRVKIYKIQRRN